MGWSSLLVCAALVSCDVLAENSESIKNHGVINFAQLSSLHHGASDTFQNYLNSPYASQFAKFEHLDKDKEVHQNVKTIIVTKKVPVPYTVQVERKVPYPVKVPVRRPYAIYVPKPYLVEIPKPVPYAIKVPVPQPFTVEKHVPVPYRVAVDKPYPVQIPKPYPVIVERKVPVTVEKHVPYQVKVPVEKPVAVPVPVEKHVPVHFSDDKSLNFDQQYALALEQQHAFSGHFDSNSEHAQLAPYYTYQNAEYFQKHLNNHGQATVEVQGKSFQPSPEDPTVSTLAVGQQPKVISFLPGSNAQEHISYYYPNTFPHNDAISSNTNHQAQKIGPMHPLGFQWSKHFNGDWTPKNPAFVTVSTQKPPSQTASYSPDNGKTVYKFSLERNPDHFPQASHTFVSESYGTKNKPSQQKILYNQIIDASPSKIENNKQQNQNRKKNQNTDRYITGAEGLKSMYLDLSKQKSPYVNVDFQNHHLTSAQKFSLLNPSFEKIEYSKSQQLPSNFNAPKFTQAQISEYFDYSNAQPLVQSQPTKQSTPYFQTLQHLHSYNPIYQNISSNYQYAYPFQGLNANMFSLSQYPNIYSNQHAYVTAHDGNRHHISNSQDRNGNQKASDIFSNHNYESGNKNQDENKDNVYASLISVNKEQPDKYQTQVPTPKVQLYEMSPLMQSASEQEQVSIIHQTTPHPTNEIKVQSNNNEVSNGQLRSYMDESQNNHHQQASTSDIIYGSPIPYNEEKIRTVQVKEKRRSSHVDRKHKVTTSRDIPTVKSMTSTFEPSPHYSTVSQVTQPSSLNLKSQVPNPLENQLYQTTSPQPDHVSKVQVTRNFANSLPHKMAYTINPESSHKKNDDWKRGEGKHHSTEKINKETKPRESTRRQRGTKRPDRISEFVKPTNNDTSTTISTVRTRGTRRSHRQRASEEIKHRSEVTTTPKAEESIEIASSTKVEEVELTDDVMKVFQTTSKVEHSSGKETDEATPATSFTDITRTFPRKSRRRATRRHSTHHHYHPDSQDNSTTTTSPLILLSTVNYSSTTNHSTTANYPSTSNYPSTPNYPSTANYPATSNYPSPANYPVPFHLSSPAQYTTSQLISSPSNATQSESISPTPQ